MSRDSLVRAKQACKDDCATSREDVEKELSHYDFRGKAMFLPCDGTRSEFWKYFRENFNKLGLKNPIASTKMFQDARSGTLITKMKAVLSMFISTAMAILEILRFVDTGMSVMLL